MICLYLVSFRADEGKGVASKLLDPWKVLKKNVQLREYFAFHDGDYE